MSWFIAVGFVVSFFSNAQAQPEKFIDDKTSLILNVDPNCYVVEFELSPGEAVPCTEPLAIRYTRRECSGGVLKEVGEVNAVVTCEDVKRMGFRFKSSVGAVLANVRVQRMADGKKGTKATYVVESARADTSTLIKLLPEPEIKTITAEAAAERPPEKISDKMSEKALEKSTADKKLRADEKKASFQFKFSGFVSLEQERTSNYGYDVGTSTQEAQPLFDGHSTQPTQSNTNIFSVFGFDARKDRSSLVTRFEIGETYFGSIASGGGVGASRRGDIFEVRNFFIEHSFSDLYDFNGGLITLQSDPRGFIFNDEIAAGQILYKTDLTQGKIWYGNASTQRPGAPASRDLYGGALLGLESLGRVKVTLYGIYRSKKDDLISVRDPVGLYNKVNADAHFFWAGTTFDWSANAALSFQTTGIANWVRRAPPAGILADRYTAYLGDAKMTYHWLAPQINFSIEGLMTSGATDTDAGNGVNIAGSSKSFVSPIGNSYLLTVATSDGEDDASGSLKQSTIANLNQAEGLRVGLSTLSFNLSQKMAAFLRYGYLRTERPGVRGSRHLGQEYDAGAVYQLTPSTVLQADYGRFYPGLFFSRQGVAELAALKMKYTF